MLSIVLPTLAIAQTSLPKPWNGEIIEPDQGLVSLYSLMIDNTVKHRHGEFTFTLKGRRTKISYSFSTATQEPSLPPQHFWKIKEDTYDLMDGSFVDERGNRRTWKGPYPKPIVVKPRSISSMGFWYLVYLKADKRFNILLKPTRLDLPIENWKGNVATVFDGITGEEFNRYQGPEAAKTQGLRRVVTGVRTIKMLYKLDLFRFNSFAGDMSRVIQSNDADIRTCYTDLLEKDETAKGQLTYAFIYSGIAQGIKSLKIRKSSVSDAVFLECLNLKLRGLTFPLRQSLAGELSFQFNIVP